MSKRYVPFVMGIVGGAAAVGLLKVGTWWSFALATLASAYAIYSIKTALTATDRQIEALTGNRPLRDYDSDD
jgi:membrane protein implicated in regulation of membrane protease activity